MSGVREKCPSLSLAVRAILKSPNTIAFLSLIRGVRVSIINFFLSEIELGKYTQIILTSCTSAQAHLPL